MARRSAMRILLAAALLVGCDSAAPITAPAGPLALEVTLLSDEGQSPDRPLPFSIEGQDFEISVVALGRDKLPLSGFDTELKLKATPGVILGDQTLTMVDGQATGTATVGLAYDQLRIWVSDEGTDDEPGSYATGVTRLLWFARPTLGEAQTSDSTTESPLENRYVPFKGAADRVDPRDLIVTTVTNDGFYLTDFTDPPGSYNSLFAFTFSRPDGIAVGSRLAELNGIIDEFLGFTELQFPSYTVLDAGHDPGPPNLLPPEILCDGAQMEPWESSVIRVNDLTSDFGGIDPCVDYNEYGQWAAEVGGGLCQGNPARINVVNINTVPEYEFEACRTGDLPAVRHLDYLVGILRHNRYASPPWLIEVRSCFDFPPDERPASCGSVERSFISGPRKAPAYTYRDFPACDHRPNHYRN